MKSIIFIILSTIITINGFSQEKNAAKNLIFTDEISLNFAFNNQNKNINDYFKDKYQNYNDKSITTIGVSYATGFYFCNRFGNMLEIGYNIGQSSTNNKEQYKRLSSATIAYTLEYDVIQEIAEHGFGNITFRTGFGVDYTSFLFSRKNEPVDIESYSYVNYFVPINLSFWLGINRNNDKYNTKRGCIFIQYNILAIKGDTKYTKIDSKPEDKIPNVAQNNLVIGLKRRF